MAFSALESALLNRIQSDFPLAERPCREIAAAIGADENEVRDTLSSLRARGIVRIIAGIFNAESLGYETSLVAFEVDGADADDAARIINGHPGVSHNYLRDHHFNIWFTLAVDRATSLHKTVESLAERTRATRHLILKTEMLYKIGLNLRIGDGAAGATLAHAINPAPPRALSADEREAVRLLQIDLPDADEPFRALIDLNAGTIVQGALVGIARALRDEGVMRRYAATVRHREAGYTANAMTVWRPERAMNDVIDVFIDEPAISHLYKRTVYPHTWEYPLFAMIHARTERDLADTVSRLSRASGITDYLVLKSLREFAKRRVVYRP